jgi:cytochrome c oxidase subunit I
VTEALAPQRLRQVWETRPGLAGWLGTVDHKEIGLRYIVTAFVFFLLAGVEALLMRLQLAVPENTLLDPNAYNQLFTMHGTTMVFLFATPIQSGIANYIVPLLIGSRDMAFPRVNALSYWIFLLAGVFMYSSFLIGAAPNGGWFNYVPLTGQQYSPGPNIDFWAIGLIFLAVSSTGGAINFIVTIFKLRAPGMSINRMPLFLWNLTVTSFMLVFALPALTAANVLLELDRKFGTQFFDPAGGGNPLLWQHLFWVFGHPDVYIIFLPAIGMVSTILPVFVRRPVVGYTWIALATVATGVLGFGVWVHHMFATGLSLLSMSFFAAASLMITIPTAIQIFAWLATIWLGRPVWRMPFLYILAFFVDFVIGGLSGIMFAAIPFDWQVTDTYFVVAHFHYVLIGGAVFPIFAGLHYWLPKMTGRMLSEGLGRLEFALVFIGFNLAFFPMHVTGLLGMPRRVYTYMPGLGWDGLNLLSTIGAFVLGLGVLVFLVNVILSQRHGDLAGDDPWGGSTLEWAMSSPPPPYDFRRIPVIRGRDPLWDPYPEFAGGNGRVVLHGRETLGTSLHDADPENTLSMPEDSGWPLALAAALAVVAWGVVANWLWLAALGGLGAFAALVGWLWPTEELTP